MNEGDASQEGPAHSSQFSALAPLIPDHVPPELVYDFEHYGDPAFASDPFAVFDRIAADAPPIFYSPKLGGFWVVTRYADVFETYRDNKVFSSRHIGVPAAVMPYVLKPLQSDPPNHVKYRRILDPVFTKQKMEQWNPRIREIARDLIRDFREKGQCEFITEFAQYLPNRIFSALAGLPEDRFDDFMSWEKALLHGETPEARFAGMQSIENFVAEHFLSRRGQPRRDDLTDVVAYAEIDGQRLSDEDIKSVGFLLYIAGLDTVQSMTGFAFLHLATHPADQMAMRKSDEARARGLEEILRLHGIVASGRTVIKDTEFKGVRMKAGDRILTFAGFGNRDAEKFPRGGTSDITPKLNPHLTFGAGPHLCLGMHLARNELNISMDEIFKNIPAFKLQRPAVTHAGGVCGVDELYLEW